LANELLQVLRILEELLRLPGNYYAPIAMYFTLKRGNTIPMTGEGQEAPGGEDARRAVPAAEPGPV